MLMGIKINVSWNHHINIELKGEIPALTTTISITRLKFSGHYYKNNDEVISNIILCDPKHSFRSKGRPYFHEPT